MSRVPVAFALLALALLAPGCSLVTDSSRFVGSFDGGGVDASPLDGAVDGDSAVPVLTAIGLSTYMPVAGEILRTSPGPIVGGVAPTRVLRAWYLDEATTPASTDSTFPTTGLPAGTRIRLEAWAAGADDVEGPRLTVGPVTLLGPPAWRPLLPDPNLATGLVVYDSAHQRWLRISRGMLFEDRVEGTRLVHVPLAPTGTGPHPLGTPIAAVLDAPRERVFVLANRPARAEIEVYELDVSVRGAERWALVDTDSVGPPPEARLFSPALYDEAGNRLWLLPGFVDGSDPIRLDMLDFSTPTPTWTSHETPPGFEARPAAAVVMSPTEPGVGYLFGGGRFEGGGIVARTDLLRLILDPSAPRAEQVPGATLPRAIFGGQACAVGDTVYLAGGAIELGEAIAATSGLFRFSPATGTLEEISTTFDGAGVFGVVAPDPTPGSAGALLMMSYVPRDPAHDSFATAIVRVATASGAGMRLATEELPIPRTGATGLDPTATMSLRVLGGFGDDLTTPTMWELSLSDLSWDFLPIARSAADEAPARRRFMRNWSVRQAVVYQGLDFSNAIVDDGLWLLDVGFGTTAWQRGSFATASPPFSFDALPPGFDVTVFAGGGCGGDPFFFGGERTDRSVSDELYELRCTGASDCLFLPGTDQGPRPTDGRPWPSPRAESVALDLPMPRLALLVGGRGSDGAALGDLWTLDTCMTGAEARFQPLVPTGTAPIPRRSPAVGVFQRAGRSEVLMFGGVAGDGSLDSSFFDDTHRLVVSSRTEAAWTPVEVSGLRPLGRFGAVGRALHDTTTGRERFIVYGGTAPLASTPLGDVWELVVVP